MNITKKRSPTTKLTRGAVELRSFLRDEGLDQERGAEALAISAAWISEMLSGKCVPSLVVQLKIDRWTNGRVSPAMWGDATAEIQAVVPHGRPTGTED